MYSNGEKTDMANVINMLLPLRVYADNKQFPKNDSSQFHLTKRI
jgi:hypothetical protein